MRKGKLIKDMGVSKQEMKQREIKTGRKLFVMTGNGRRPVVGFIC